MFREQGRTFEDELFTSPEVVHKLATKELRGQRQKPGTWQHWCSKGRRLINSELVSRLMNGMHSEEGKSAFSIIFSYIGGIVHSGEEGATFLDFPSEFLLRLCIHKFSKWFP